MERWLLGMLLALLGCFCSSIGLVLMKHSTAVEADLPLLRRRFWAIGFLFLIVNASVIDVVAFSLAPITLIAPFTGVTIVFTSWLASTGLLYVKETLDVYDTTSTGITLFGVLLTSIYGPHIDDIPNDVNMLYEYFFQKPFRDCLTCLGLALLLGWIAEASSALRCRRCSSTVSKLVHSRTSAARIMLYAYTASLAGALSMLLLKVIGTGLFASIEHDQPLLTRGWLLSFLGLSTRPRPRPRTLAVFELAFWRVLMFPLMAACAQVCVHSCSSRS